MVSIVEDGNSTVDIVFQVRTNQLAKPHALATHIAPIGHAGVEESEQTTIGILHLADEMTFVALGIDVEQLRNLVCIIATKYIMHNLGAIGIVVKWRLEYFGDVLEIHLFDYLNVSERIISALVSATCLVVVGICGWL